MPKLEFYLDPEENAMITEVLAEANKSKTDKEKLSEQQHMVGILADYISNSLASYRTWKSSGMIGNALYRPDLKLEPAPTDILIETPPTAPDAVKKTVVIGALTLENLRRSMVWLNGFQKDVMRTQLQFSAVVAFAKYIIIGKTVEDYKPLETKALKEEQTE